MPDSRGFYWGKEDTANTPGMMLSIFPDNDVDSGLITGKTIEIEVMATKWIDVAKFGSPKQPKIPNKVKKFLKNAADTAATTLALGAASSLFIISSLY